MWGPSWKVPGLLPLLLLAGCASEIGDNRLTWVWAVLPLGIFGILGTYGVYWQRKDQLARWDLRSSPVPPDGRTAVSGLSAVAVAVAIGFAVVNWLARDVDATQKLLNLAVWCAGSALSAGLAIVLGWRLAERSYPRRAE